VIALFSGTSEGRKIIKELEKNKIKTIVFTATAYGGSLVPKSKHISINSGQLSKEKLERIFKERKIDKILDATHPYAETISKTLIELSNNMKILYYRYEREDIEIEESSTIKKFSTYEEIIDFLENNAGNILLTNGSKNLHKFVKKIDKNRLHTRILPMPKYIKKTLDLGIDLKRIIGMQGPFSREINEALIKNFEIKYMVAKNSGKEGGLEEKIEAAEETGLKLLILDKPKVNYPNKYKSINKIVENVK